MFKSAVSSVPAGYTETAPLKAAPFPTVTDAERYEVQVSKAPQTQTQTCRLQRSLGSATTEAPPRGCAVHYRVVTFLGVVSWEGPESLESLESLES